MMPTPVGPRPVSAGPLPAMPVRAELSRQSWRMSAEPDVAQPGAPARAGQPGAAGTTAADVTALLDEAFGAEPG